MLILKAIVVIGSGHVRLSVASVLIHKIYYYIYQNPNTRTNLNLIFSKTRKEGYVLCPISGDCIEPYTIGIYYSYNITIL